MATKADVESVKVKLERIKDDLGAEIRDSKISTIVWLTGIMAGLFGTTIAILKVWPP